MVKMFVSLIVILTRIDFSYEFALNFMHTNKFYDFIVMQVMKISEN